MINYATICLKLKKFVNIHIRTEMLSQ